MQTQPELSTDYPKLITWGIAGLALLISFLSFGVSALALYLQRRDKKPRVSIVLERSYAKMSEPDSRGFPVLRPVAGFTIRAFNLTERLIKVESVYFVGKDKCRYILPSVWENFKEILPQDNCAITIPLNSLRDWIQNLPIEQPKKGRFVLQDGLANEYKSPMVGDLSSKPISKLEKGISLDI